MSPGTIAGIPAVQRLPSIDVVLALESFAPSLHTNAAEDYISGERLHHLNVAGQHTRDIGLVGRRNGINRP